MAGTKPKVRSDLTVVELDGEAVVYNDDTCELHHLNATAALVFSLLDGGGTIEELAADLAAAFSIPQGEMEGQLRVIVHNFEHAQLLETGSFEHEHDRG